MGRVRPPELKVSTPAHSKHLGWYVEFEVPGDAGNAGAVTVKWMAGPASGIWDVHMPFYLSAQSMLFHMDKSGGGVFANIWFWGADHDVNTVS